jgi:hypothetical protein
MEREPPPPTQAGSRSEVLEWLKAFGVVIGEHLLVMLLTPVAIIAFGAVLVLILRPISHGMSYPAWGLAAVVAIVMVFTVRASVRAWKNLGFIARVAHVLLNSIGIVMVLTLILFLTVSLFKAP